MNTRVKYHLLGVGWMLFLGCGGQEQPASLSAPKGTEQGTKEQRTGQTEAGPEPNTTMLITAKTLAGQLGSAKLRVLDARPNNEYQAEHIPGAVWVNVDDWTKLALGEGGQHNREAWAHRVSSLGIDQDSTVVVLGGSLTNAARIWWSLKYLGIAEVRLLDGGWEIWKSEHRATTVDKPEITASSFEPRFQPDRLAEIADLKQWIEGEKVAVVDARSDGEFTGQQARGPRGGHIPGARHLEWNNLIAEDGRFKSSEELRAMFEKLGIAPEQTVVTY